MPGSASELMNDLDGAFTAYERALRHNYQSITAMNAISCILRTKENFPKAVEFLQAILKLDANNGEVWGSLGMDSGVCDASRLLIRSTGHCYLMMEDLQQAYAAYQQALYHLRDPKASPATQWFAAFANPSSTGAQAVVWHRYTVRSLRISRACRRSFLSGHEDAARLRKSQRDILPTWYYLQTTTEI